MTFCLSPISILRVFTGLASPEQQQQLPFATSLVGLCQQQKLYSTVRKEEFGFLDDWIFSIKDVISNAVKAANACCVHRHPLPGTLLG
ncbi:hypothetical protein WJX77_001028 [Trebouxia sp. C0004]